MLGHAIRAIQMGRGGREGNNALINPALHYQQRNIIQALLEGDAPFDIIQRATTAQYLNSWQICSNIYHVRPRDVCASRLHFLLSRLFELGTGSWQPNSSKPTLPTSSTTFTFRCDNHHRTMCADCCTAANSTQVLLNDNQDLKPFRAVSVKKKGQENKDVTPLHAAAINPNPKYLAELLAVDPDFNHPDANGLMLLYLQLCC